MARKAGRALVIDASVAQSAGMTEHPISRACREFLKAVLRICHTMVVAPELSDEWRKHRSRFSHTWRASMRARKKLVYREQPADRDMRRRVAEALSDENDRAAVEKDIHLVEAALSTDRVVVSRDDKARTLLDSAAAQVRELRSVAWVNPTNPIEEPIAWLEAGANLEPGRCLGAGGGSTHSRHERV